MAPFYAAYLRNLLPSIQPTKHHYDDGGMVSTQAQPQGIGGPTTLGSNPATNSGGVAGAGAGVSNLIKNGTPLSVIPGVGGAIDSTIGSFTSPFQNNFQAQAAPIQNGTSVDQLNAAYNGAQSGLQQQQNLVNALNAQNGLANQSGVFNQFQDIANGRGPNPAMAQLNQRTGQNIAAQNALMAGQRGSSANPGMIARQAAMQGANTQQNAIGQGAALQAQQSLNALGSMGNIAGNQVSNQMAATQGINNAAQNEQSILQNANAGYNSNLVNMQNGMNQVNAGVAAGNQNAMGQLGGGLLSGGGLMSSLAEGGEVQNYDQGGPVEVTEPMLSAPQPVQSQIGPQSSAGQWLNSTGNAPVSGAPSYTAPAQTNWGMSGSGKSGGGMGGMMGLLALAKGGEVDAMVSPGEQYLAPKDVKKIEKGADPLSVGEKIPGKAKHKGDNYANDTVPKKLEAGGIVLPKSVMESKHPHWAAHKFVSSIMAKHGKSLPKKK